MQLECVGCLCDGREAGAWGATWEQLVLTRADSAIDAPAPSGGARADVKPSAFFSFRRPAARAPPASSACWTSCPPRWAPLIVYLRVVGAGCGFCSLPHAALPGGCVLEDAVAAGEVWATTCLDLDPLSHMPLPRRSTSASRCSSAASGRSSVSVQAPGRPVGECAAAAGPACCVPICARTAGPPAELSPAPHPLTCSTFSCPDPQTWRACCRRSLPPSKLALLMLAVAGTTFARSRAPQTTPSLPYSFLPCSCFAAPPLHPRRSPLRIPPRSVSPCCPYFIWRRARLPWRCRLVLLSSAPACTPAPSCAARL